MFFRMLFLSCFLFMFNAASQVQLSDPVLLTDQGNDKGSGYSMQTKIVTCDAGGIRKTHFAYTCINSSTFKHWEGMSVWVAAYNHSTKEIESHTFIGNIFDNHGTPCMAVDKQGYLYIVYGPHHHPFHYRKSRLPNNSTEWENKEILSFMYGRVDSDTSYWRQDKMIEKNGEMEWTYPVIRVDEDNIIHVAGSLGPAVGYVRKINNKWEKPRIIYNAEKSLCRYNVMMNISKKGIVYILAPDMEISKNDNNYYQMNTDYYLFKSNDNGENFNTMGKVFSGFVQGCGNLSVDENENIHFLAMLRNYEKRSHQYHFYYDGKKWHENLLTVPERYIWDSSMTLTKDGTVLILSTANKSDNHWRHASNEIYLFTGVQDSVHGFNFTHEKVIAKAAERNHWLPSLEENQIFSNFDENQFFIMWTDEPDLKGQYTKFKHAQLATKVYCKLFLK